jgi:hypothetical protein
MQRLVPSRKRLSTRAAVHRPLVSDSRLRPEPTLRANSGRATMSRKRADEYRHIVERQSGTDQKNNVRCTTFFSQRPRLTQHRTFS